MRDMQRRLVPGTAPEPRTVALPPLSFRAQVDGASIDPEARTAELIFSTGAPVERYDWTTGKRYLETLSLEPGAVRMGRLNGGAPILDSHSSYSVADILGAVVRDSATLSGGKGRAVAQFSRREAVDGIWQDVQDGIIGNVSVGYRVYKFVETQGKSNALPVREAVDWEPFEISMVPIPADAGAKVREGKSDDANTCEIVPAGYVARAAETTPAAPAAQVQQTQAAAVPAAVPKETTVDQNQRADSFVADMTLQPPPAPAPKAEPTDADRATLAERERVQGIEQACSQARMPAPFTRKLIGDGIPLVDALRQVFVEMGRRNDNGVPNPASRGPQVEVTGEDPNVVTRAALAEALLHKSHPHRVIREAVKNPDGSFRSEEREVGFKLTDNGRRYMGLSLMRIAERMLIARGIRTEGMADMDIASLALRSDGMHSTSDFPLLLADVANKSLRAAYNEAPQTFEAITRRTTVPDFKTVKRNQFGEAPALELVNEHGEVVSGTIGEGKESYNVEEYAVKFAITRKAIINDDLGAFSRIPAAMGRKARDKESDLVWAQLTSNPAMGDGNNLFSDAHSNWDNSGAAIAVESIGAGRAAMRTQKGLDGLTPLNITPRLLIVPAALETLADQFVSQNLMASAAGSVNPFAGKLQVITDSRLDTASAQIWYLAAAIGEFADIIELAMLEGQTGPTLTQEIGFDIEGVKFKIRHDIGAKVIDWRGLYRNAGVTIT